MKALEILKIIHKDLDYSYLTSNDWIKSEYVNEAIEELKIFQDKLKDAEWRVELAVTQLATIQLSEVKTTEFNRGVKECFDFITLIAANTEDTIKNEILYDTAEYMLETLSPSSHIKWKEISELQKQIQELQSNSCCKCQYSIKYPSCLECTLLQYPDSEGTISYLEVDKNFSCKKFKERNSND